MNPLLIPTIVLAVLVIGFGSLAIWAYLGYNDQKTNVQAKVDVAVADAKKSQSDSDQAKYLEQEKQPYRTFQGPSELGGVSFSYPKTWSVYVDKDGAAGGVYEAYLQPGIVPPLSSQTPYATRVSIGATSYESTLTSYSGLVKSGKLKSTPVTINGQDGTRLDGDFTTKVQGSMVIMKIRDKTLKVFTEAPVFANDYNNAVLSTLKFNP